MTTTLFTEDFLYGEELEADPRTDLLPPWERERLLEETADNVEPPADPDCETPGCQEVRTFAAIADHGGRVLTGTDSPIDNVALGVHANLRMLVEYGWSPYDALRTATVNPAQHMGVDGDVGTLEEGKVADLIMVDGDPLANIDDAMNVRMTMSGGRLHSTEDLTEPFAAGSQEPASERSGALPATEVTARVEPGSSRYWWHAPEVVAADHEHNCGVLGTHDHRQHEH